MRHQSPIQSQPFGRTIVIAGAVLAAAALFQMGGLAWAFYQNMRGGVAGNGDGDGRYPPMKIDVSRIIAESPPPEAPDGLGNDPLSSAPDDAPPGPAPVQAVPVAVPPAIVAAIPHATAIGQPPKPTPVPLSAFTPKMNPRFNELVEQGKLLRGSGDTAGALVKFREAAGLDPGNALAIAEQAFTFEKMSLPDKAAEQWRRILSMGDRAGVYFSAAKAKLDTAVQGSIRQTAGKSPDIAQGKQMAVGETTIAEEKDASAAKKFTLSVPVRARVAEPISVRDLKLFVLFYERVDGKEISRTIANVSNRWASPPADWADGDTENLEVTYELAAASARGERREYYGYIVRLYYRGELQDTKAEPASLSQKFPAPYTLSE